MWNAEIANILQPLLALTNLQKLALEFPGVEILDDPWLDRASKSLPRLQDLTIHGCDLERKRITLAGYVPLLQDCPKLFQLSIATACKSFDIKKALPPGLCNQNITQLHRLEPCIESSVGSIFRCLVLMFSNLEYLDWPSDPLQKKHGSCGFSYIYRSTTAKGIDVYKQKNSIFI